MQALLELAGALATVDEVGVRVDQARRDEGALQVVLGCGVAAALGYLAVDLNSDVSGMRLAALAAGGLLAMLTNSLVPFAYERGGQIAGVATVVGFCVSLMGT